MSDAGRKTITETVYEACEFDEEWPPYKLSEFWQWLRDMNAEIPHDAKHAWITMGSRMDDDGGSAWLKITYDRMETDAEFRSRIELEYGQMLQRYGARK